MLHSISEMAKAGNRVNLPLWTERLRKSPVMPKVAQNVVPMCWDDTGLRKKNKVLSEQCYCFVSNLAIAALAASATETNPSKLLRSLSQQLMKTR